MSGEIFTVEVPMLAPSVNGYWKVAKWGGRYITPKGIAFKKLVALAVGARKLNWAKPLKLEIELHSDKWWTKKGTISKTAGDVDNYCKSSLDSLFACFEMDDSQVFDLHVVKVVGTEKTVFRLGEID